MQEAGYDARSAASNCGMAVSRGTRGTAIAYDATRFEPISTVKSEHLPGDDHGGRSGTAIAQDFYDRGTGKTITVTDVHAGHNGTPNKLHYDSAKEALDRINGLQSKMAGSVKLTGGDFNEMTKLVGRRAMGAGVDKYSNTHSMGANDKTGAKGDGVFASSTVGRRFGSDHASVTLKVCM